jgi:hypothetical protein
MVHSLLNPNILGNQSIFLEEVAKGRNLHKSLVLQWLWNFVNGQPSLGGNRPV